MTAEPLRGKSRTEIICACENECGDVLEGDDQERAVCKGLRGSGFEHDGLIAERDRLRAVLDDSLVALNRWHDSEDHDEQFIMDARALLTEAKS